MSATFAFTKRVFDDAFHTLDRVVADVARSTPGDLGEEKWKQPSNGLVSNVCFRQGMESLQALMQHPAHIDARQRPHQSLAGYPVVIAEVVPAMQTRRPHVKSAPKVRRFGKARAVVRTQK